MRTKRRRLQAGELKLVRWLNELLSHAPLIKKLVKSTPAWELRQRIEAVIRAARPPRKHDELRDALNTYFDFLESYNALPRNFRLVYIPNLHKIGLASKTSLGDLTGMIFPDAYGNFISSYTQLVEMRTKFAELLDEFHRWMLKDFKPALGVCKYALCGKVFVLKRADQIFCSDTCRSRYARAQERATAKG